MARSTSRPTRRVEESSAAAQSMAAQSMAEQARALREAVAVFTTPDADAWHAR